MLQVESCCCLLKGDLFGLALKGLNVLQESGESRMGIVRLEAIGVDQLARINTLESHASEPFHENQCFDHQLDMARVERGCHVTWDVEGMKAVTDAKAQLANVKEAFGMPEGWVSADMSALRSAMKGRDGV